MGYVSGGQKIVNVLTRMQVGLRLLRSPSSIGSHPNMT